MARERALEEAKQSGSDEEEKQQEEATRRWWSGSDEGACVGVSVKQNKQANSELAVKSIVSSFSSLLL
jgi:hypothetical protein